MSSYFKYVIVLLSFCLFSLSLQAQETCKGKKKAERLFEKAQENWGLHQNKAKQEAYKQLIESIKIDPNCAASNFMLGKINFTRALKTNDIKKKTQLKNRAMKYFKQVLKTCPEYHDFEAAFLLGNLQYNQKSYALAQPNINNYLEHTQNGLYHKEAQKISEHLKTYFYLISHPVSFEPQIVEGVSTKEDEFLPMISPDGELAIYTHRYFAKDQLNDGGKIVEELAFSVKEQNGQSINDYFSKGKKMPYPFNVEGLDQGAMSMTIDNSELYITICQLTKSRGGAFSNCDIYVSYNKNGQWSELKNLGTNINGKYSWESQPSISADGNMLFFASVRPENIGFDYDNNQTSDIYYSIRDKNGQWGKAQNIGAPINTKGNEKSPFLHTDSETLYFSSDELPGVGGYDIFYSKKDQEKWTKPTNIGYPINKETNDLGFFVSTNGQKAYFSSDQLDDNRRWNVYSFDLYEEARPQKVFFAKGQLLDEKGKALTDAKIEIKTSSSGRIQSGMVDKETGDYAIAVSVKKDEEILMTVKKKGHAFSSRYFKQDEALTNQPLKVSMEVKKIKVGESVEINDIHFATNSSDLTKGSRFILDDFADYLKYNPNIRIEIHGHTDNVGNFADNLKLSENRAKSVMDYLIEKGVDSMQIQKYRGFGETKPVASNQTKEGRAKNRRTEFLIVKH